MKYVICSSVFFIVYLISVIIFYYLDFFQIKDCKGNIIHTDWGKIIGYALLPSFGLMIVSWYLCQIKRNKKRVRWDSRMGFDSQDSELESDIMSIDSTMNFHDSANLDNSMNFHKPMNFSNINRNNNQMKFNSSKYSCGM